MTTKLVTDLVEGDMVDLVNDPFAHHCANDTCPDPDAHEADRMYDECEYAVVANIEQETPDCVRVDFESRDSIGFPTNHSVVINDDA